MAIGRNQIRNPNVEIRNKLENRKRDPDWGAPRAKENLKSMEQCFRANAEKLRLLARPLFHDCSTRLVRG
jgi:hypothetical protein